MAIFSRVHTLYWTKHSRHLFLKAFCEFRFSLQMITAATTIMIHAAYHSMINCLCMCWNSIHRTTFTSKWVKLDLQYVHVHKSLLPLVLSSCGRAGGFAIYFFLFIFFLVQLALSFGLFLIISMLRAPIQRDIYNLFTCWMSYEWNDCLHPVVAVCTCYQPDAYRCKWSLIWLASWPCLCRLRNLERWSFYTRHVNPNHAAWPYLYLSESMYALCLCAYSILALVSSSKASFESWKQVRKMLAPGISRGWLINGFDLLPYDPWQYPCHDHL